MQSYKNTTNIFAEYLISHGYPKECIAFEWGEKNNLADIVVLDLDTNIPIAIYEIKGMKTEDNFKMSIKQLRKFYAHLKYPVNYGIVFSKDTTPFFEFFDVTKEINAGDEIPLKSIEEHGDEKEPLNYRNRSQGIKSSVINEQNMKNSRSVDIIKIISWLIIPLIIIGLLLLDAFRIFVFTSERLLMYGITVIVVFLPFIGQIRLGMYTFTLKGEENEKKGKEKNDNQS